MKRYCVALCAILVLFANRPAGAQCVPDDWALPFPSVGPSGDFSEDIYEISGGGGYFNAVGNGGTIYNSVDGVTWVKKQNLPIGNARGLLFVSNTAGEHLVAVGEDARILRINPATGAPGSTGSVASLGSPIPDLTGIAYGDGVWVAVGFAFSIANGYQNIFLRTSATDAASGWSEVDRINVSNASFTVRGVTHGDGKFVAVLGNGRVSTSTDGVNWTSGSTTSSSDFEFIEAGGGTFVAGGDNGLYRSTNGTSWTFEASGRFYGGALSPDGVWAVSGLDTNNDGEILYSTNDGLKWVDGFTGPVPLSPFNDIALGDIGWALGGSDGRRLISFSPCGDPPVFAAVLDQEAFVGLPVAIYVMATDVDGPNALSYSVQVNGSSTLPGDMTLAGTDSLQGDLNLDGSVDFVDLGLMKLAFFTQRGTPQYNPYADLNSSGNVDFVDLGLMRQNFFGKAGIVVRVLSWTPTAADVGSLNVTVTADDGAGTSSISFPLEVCASAPCP